MDRITQPESGAPDAVHTAKEMISSINELLSACVRAMVMQPGEVSVLVHYSQDTITFCITVADSDLGRLIGKNGSAIQGLRAVVKSANRTTKRMSLRLVTRADKEI